MINPRTHPRHHVIPLIHKLQHIHQILTVTQTPHQILHKLMKNPLTPLSIPLVNDTPHPSKTHWTPTHRTRLTTLLIPSPHTFITK